MIHFSSVPMQKISPLTLCVLDLVVQKTIMAALEGINARIDLAPNWCLHLFWTTGTCFVLLIAQDWVSLTPFHLPLGIWLTRTRPQSRGSLFCDVTWDPRLHSKWYKIYVYWVIFKIFPGNSEIDATAVLLLLRIRTSNNSWLGLANNTQDERFTPFLVIKIKGKDCWHLD
jgi:hypothetical protein